MSAIPFSRDKITYRSGVQLLNLVDNTNRGVASSADQTFALVGRFDRGPIDGAFTVSQGTRTRMLGASNSLLVNALNEAQIQLYEALDAGAATSVVSRLVPAAAVNSYMVATLNATTGVVTWTTAATLPTDYLVAIKHLECFNDGVQIGIHAVEAVDASDVEIASSEIVIRLIDVVTGDQLFDDFQGSLLVAAKDDNNMSYYLPSVVSSQTEFVEITVKGTTVPVNSNIYGTDADGNDQFATATLSYFSEGGTSYANTDYDDALQRLFDTDIPYGYMHSGGSKNTALLSKMTSFAYKVNKPWFLDVDGSLSVAAAIAFIKNLNLTDSKSDFYPVIYWMPVVSDDPLNGGSVYLGASGLQVGMRCNRNAQTDANGVAPKHQPVAGRDYPISRTGARQKRKLSTDDLENLAKVGINPVCYETYSDGSFLVFRDSLTAARTTSDRKLSSIAEMAAAIDDDITAYSKAVLQKDIDTAVDKITKYIEKTFEAYQTAGWFVPSDQLKGMDYTATIVPNSRFPKEKVDVRYSISYQGVARIITVQQTLSK